MNKYAVAHMNFFDNDLQIKIVDAISEKEAVIQAFGLGYAFENAEDLKQAKCNAFDADEMFEVAILDEAVLYEFEYSDGYVTQREFSSDREAKWFACNEGDHLLSYQKLA